MNATSIDRLSWAVGVAVGIAAALPEEQKEVKEVLRCLANTIDDVTRVETIKDGQRKAD